MWVRLVVGLTGVEYGWWWVWLVVGLAGSGSGW